ncbi:MAG: C25 family cysteine peptidase [Flavobacteriales bacterium]|nr:C25 family cysteine peptidase [Flavobacteriales bacterium]
MRFIAIILCLLSLPTFGQLGNEWIDYSRQYWRFEVVEDGVYQLSYEEMAQAAFPINGINVDEIKLFGRGQEQFVEVIDQNNDGFGPGDYLQFYAQKNDGWLDQWAYDQPQNQVNSNYSLFNDTANYFLTWAPGPSLRTQDYIPSGTLDNYNEAPWVSSRSRLDFNLEYLLGVQDNNGISLPFYEQAEGWYDTRFPQGATRSHAIPHPEMYDGPGAPEAIFTATSASASSASGVYNHHLQVGWGNNFNQVVDTIYWGYQHNCFEWTVPADQLGGGATTVTHRSIDDLDVATDWHSVGWMELRYGRQPNFNATLLHRFQLKNFDANAEGRLDIVFNGDNPALYEITSNGLKRALPLTLIEAEWRSLVPFLDNPSGTELLLYDSALAQEITNLQPINQSGYFTDYTAVEQDSAFVIVAHPSLLDAATNYAFYRETQGMEALVASVDELYMQYAAGVWKHPLAIRRFCDHLLQSWESYPSHLFLIGKSIFEMKISNTQGARNNPSNYARNLVPSWGYPTSDIAFTSGLNDSDLDMAIPTGRLAAENSETVLDYLNKVIELEAQPPSDWMKRVIHFGGGGNSFEQGLFSGYLNTYRGIAQDTCFGGDVYSFFKTSTDPIQLNLSDSIALLIEEGVSLMTFFGHASSTGFDVNIDSPGSYNNQGKYPLLIGNSCYTGNIHLPTNFRTSEEFVLEPNAGVIGFIAKGDLGAPGYLNIWTENFYRQLFQENYGGSIGQNMRRAVQAFQGQSTNLLTINTALTFSLHGDPAVVLNAWDLPDYSVSVEDVIFEPEEVSTELEEFTVKVALTNLGKAVNQPFGVELIRHLPTGQDTSLFVEMAPVYFRDTAYFTLPVDLLNGVGLNNFDVLVDFPVNAVEELEELSNNTISGAELLITSGNLIPVYPFNYAIEPEGTATLKASTGDPFAENHSYRFEIDTVDSFDSPQLQQGQVMSTGGVVEWEVPINLEDQVVYYWRTAAEVDTGEELNWRMHSFQYQAGERGWGQSHFDQFRFNRYDQVTFDEAESDFDFFTGDVNMKCTVYGDPADVFEISATRYQLDLDVQDYGGCGSAAALHVAVMDPITLAPWESNYNDLFPENDFGNLMDCANGRNRPEKYFIFRQNNPDEMSGLVDLLSNQIPDNHYLLVYTWKYVNYDGWDAYGPELYDLFADMGSMAINTNAQDSVPFIFFTRMGDLASAEEIYGVEQSQLIEMETTMTGNFGIGGMTSPVFGPVTNWEALYWNYDEEEGDSTRVKVLGSNIGQPDVELADFISDEEEWQNLGMEVNANQYPTLRLQTALHDDENQTPAQINYWQLISDHVPECALNPLAGFWFPKDTVEKGEELPIAIAIENIGQFDMDSLLVRYEISSSGGTPIPVTYQRQAPLVVGDILLDTLMIPTFGLSGDLTLRVEVNPAVAQGIYDQPEQYHFNNIAELRFHVSEDRINPILDVTFDGLHILNGDIISDQPMIRVSLDDENPFLLLNEEADTSLFQLFVNWPDGMQQQVYFSETDILRFFPAMDERNKAYLEYTPLFDQDGKYTLFVQAQDKSGNQSGDIDYTIEFTIDSHPTITEVLNFPNPFSTRTQFVFTVTGTEPPDEVLIRIMTVGGRVVREIHTEELGPLKVGRNLTEFWWDGTDEFGDPLANGIYLYTVRARLHGEDLEMNSQASQYFQNGIGKMYFLR